MRLFRMHDARATRRRSIRAISAVVLAIGLALSLGAGLAAKQLVDRRDADAFEATAANIQDVVATQLDRQQDLLRNVAGMVSADPSLTNDQFETWYMRSDIAERYPGNFGIAFVAQVPRDQLDTFARRLEADPVAGMSNDETFAIVNDDGGSEQLCLVQFGLSRVAEKTGTAPPSIDMCASSLAEDVASPFPAALDSAVTTAAPALMPMTQLPVQGLLIEAVAVYGTPTVPDGAEARRAATIGWVIDIFSAPDLVLPAVAGRHGLSVAVDHDDGVAITRVASGGDETIDRSEATTLPASPDGRWTVTVGQSSQDRASGARQGLGLFVAGAIITVLVVALVRAIGGSRDRAMEIVDEKTEELVRQALHDDLTGLPNRTLLVDRTERLLAHQARYGGDVAVLFIDLDNFKAVNDSLGHGAGDAYLRAAAQRVQAIVRTADTVGRLGGDEFVVVMAGDSFDDGAVVVAEKILAVLGDPIEIGGTAVPVSCSIGIASGPCASAEALLDDADRAMYQAKQGGKGRFVVFEPGKHDDHRGRLTLAWELREALCVDGLGMSLLPLVDLRTGHPAGLEAELSWRHPARGLLGAEELAAVADGAGLSPLLGGWAMREACAQAARRRVEKPSVPIAVRVSRQQFADPALLDSVRDALEESELPGSSLSLVIDVRSLADADVEAGEVLRDLKALDVGLIVDEIGGDQTAMPQLRHFPIDAVRLDRRLSGDLTNPESRALLRTLVQMGEALDLAILAEASIRDVGSSDARRGGLAGAERPSVLSPTTPATSS